MIVVRNTFDHEVLGFPNVDAYFAWLDANPEWDFWEDAVYDVGAGGHACPETILDLRERYSVYDRARRAAGVPVANYLENGS